MGDFYTDLSTVATRLLTDKGQQVTFSRETTSGFNPATGVNTTSTSTYQSYGAAFDYRLSEIDGTIVQSGDVRFIIDSTTLPLRGDTVTLDSVVYRVMTVKKNAPGGTAVIYTVQLRK